MNMQELPDVALIGFDRLRPTCAARAPRCASQRASSAASSSWAANVDIRLRYVASWLSWHGADYLTPFLHPSLSAPESARPVPHGHGVSSTFWCRSRSIRPIPIGCRASLELKPGDIVAVPLGPREATGVVWADDVDREPGLHNRLKDVEHKLEFRR